MISGRATLLLLLLLLSTVACNSYDFGAAWGRVTQTEDDRLPKTGATIVDSIYNAAIAEGDVINRQKALIYRMKYVDDVEEDAFSRELQMVKDEIKDARPDIRALLHSMLGEMYWTYFESNRWMLLERTSLADDEQDDVMTRDARRFIEEAIKHYILSLELPEEYKKKLVADDYLPLIRKNAEEDTRPYLFDFLAYRAIDMLGNDNAGIARPQDSFRLGPEYLVPAEEFAAMEISDTDTLALSYRTILIYQMLTRFHLNDDNPESLYYAEAKRFEYIRQTVGTEEINLAFEAIMKQYMEKLENDPAFVDFSYKLAYYYYLKDNRGFLAKYPPQSQRAEPKYYVMAYDICQKAIDKQLESPFNHDCRELQNDISQKLIAVSFDQCIPVGKIAPITITYRNCEEGAFNVYQLEDRHRSSKMHYRDEQKIYDYYLASEAYQHWSINLPDPKDYHERTFLAEMEALPAGEYLMHISGAGITERTERSWLRFTVTDIDWITDSSTGRIMLLDRNTGAPLAGAKVEIFRGYWAEDELPSEVRYTDENGQLDLEPGDYRFIFSYNGDRLDCRDRYGIHIPDPQRNNRRYNRSNVYFFTDRKIYRPGQTVYFKGIAVNQENDALPELLTGSSLNVKLDDANGQPVSSMECRTSEFGSFSGSFVLPQDGITGSMRLYTKHGSTSIQMEEYKRPKFEVTFEPVKEVFRLGSDIEVKGSAKSYAGPGIVDAEVKYHVKRVRYCPWFRYYFKPVMSNEQVVASGSTRTSSDGSFTVPFNLLREGITQSRFDVAYQFIVSVDIVDNSGETRSEQTIVYAGSRSLELDVIVTDAVNRETTDSFELVTQNLMQQHIPIEGVYEVERLQQPDRIFRSSGYDSQPDTTIYTREEFIRKFPHDPYLEEDDTATWPVEHRMESGSFNTGESKELVLKKLRKWDPGTYRIRLTAQDPLGTEVTITKEFVVFSPEAKQLPRLIPLWVKGLKTTCEPGEKASVLIGSSYPDATILYSWRCKNQVLKEDIIRLDNEQKVIEHPVIEDYRGGFSLIVVMLHDNRAYIEDVPIEVPWSNKKLDITWSTFRDKLEPGSKETFSVKIKDHSGEKSHAEMLVAMYDASLDQFYPNSWSLDVFPRNWLDGRWEDWSGRGRISSMLSHRISHFNPHEERMDELNWFNHNMRWRSGRRNTPMFATASYDDDAMMSQAAPRSSTSRLHLKTEAFNVEGMEMESDKAMSAGAGGAPPESSQIQVRKNFAETAFFYPELHSDESGEISFTFQVPEALTRWKLMGLAHNESLGTGTTEKFLVTQKELMVTPNLPRFLREGDRITLSARINSLSPESVSGTAELRLFDAETMNPIDEAMNSATPEVPFTLAPEGSTSIDWTISIPDTYQAVIVRMTARTASFSDGEENLLPVLPNRMLVTESLPLPIRGEKEKQFSFRKLKESGDSSTLKHHRFTLEFTTNPAWYVVQALPYMAEYPYECSEQVFTRFYANELAGFIVKQNPKIERIFSQWRDLPDSEALLSNLEKNQELKSLVLEETPWVRQAQNETERKKRIGILFDINHMSMMRQTTMRKLIQKQKPSGAWPWFEGMPESRYITQYIAEGFGHLRELGALKEGSDVVACYRKAVLWLDSRMTEDYRDLIEDGKNLDEQHIQRIHIHYLYMRSFFQDIPVEEANREAWEYYLSQAKTWWRDRSLYTSGLQALALDRLGGEEIPAKIVASMREHALHSDEMGMYWKENQPGYYWYEAPIETQSLLIELFGALGTNEEVDEMRLWLLKQKQVQDWKTTKATAEACYALLCSGSSWITSDEPVQITVGDRMVVPESLEPGTGYFKESWAGSEVDAAMGDIKVANPNDHAAWGAVYWQYFEDLDKIDSHETPLSLKKQLFIERKDASGTRLHPLSPEERIEVGDRVIVRIELRVDREMDYVHMKDMRAAGFEPENVISSSKYQDGLWYYESTRDATTNFFFNRLHKGTFVFEYPLRAFQAGEFSNGITTIQCMYAPEFTSHSEGTRIDIER